MQTKINDVTRKITVLKAHINFKDGTILLRVKDKISWTNADASTATSTSIGEMSVKLADVTITSAANMKVELETYIGTNPTYTNVNVVE
jgi:hypothetical protein